MEGRYGDQWPSRVGCPSSENEFASWTFQRWQIDPRRAIARKLALRAIHLDQLYHLPSTNWQVGPEEQFLALHEEAISGVRWVIDGNYSKCLPQRLQRATGMIILDVSTGASLFR
jgi:hypothetical protein